MPGRATPSTVFWADAMRGAPPAALGGDGPATGGAGGGDGNALSTAGGGDGYAGGAMPIMVAPKCRPAGGWLGAFGGSLPLLGVTGAGAAVKVGGAMPIMVPFKPRLGAGTAAGASTGGGGSGGGMSKVPPNAGAAGRGSPHALHVARSSVFCAPHWPHCFIAGRL